MCLHLLCTICCPDLPLLPSLLLSSSPSLLLLQVGISDEAGPSGEVAEEDGIKTEDHRVSMGVIALLEEGQRDLLGNVLVLPNARLKAVREAVTGTFEERLQKKPFYMVTTVSLTQPRVNSI